MQPACVDLPIRCILYNSLTYQFVFIQKPIIHRRIADLRLYDFQYICLAFLVSEALY